MTQMYRLFGATLALFTLLTVPFVPDSHAIPKRSNVRVTRFLASAGTYDGTAFPYTLSWKGTVRRSAAEAAEAADGGADPVLAVTVFETLKPLNVVLNDSGALLNGTETLTLTPYTRYTVQFDDSEGRLVLRTYFTSKRVPIPSKYKKPPVKATPAAVAPVVAALDPTKPAGSALGAEHKEQVWIGSMDFEKDGLCYHLAASGSITKITCKKNVNLPDVPEVVTAPAVGSSFDTKAAAAKCYSTDAAGKSKEVSCVAESASPPFQYGGGVPNSVCASHNVPGQQDWVMKLNYTNPVNGKCYLHDFNGEHEVACPAGKSYPVLPNGFIPSPYDPTFKFADANAVCYHRHADDVCIEIQCGPAYQSIGASESLGPVTMSAPADLSRVPSHICNSHNQPGEQDWLGAFSYVSAFDGKCYRHDWLGEHPIACSLGYPTLTGTSIPGPYNATFNFAGADAKCFHRHADDVCIEIFCGPPYTNIGAGTKPGPVDGGSSGGSGGPAVAPDNKIVPDSVCAQHGVPGMQDWVSKLSYRTPEGSCFLHDWAGEHPIACNPSLPLLPGGIIPGPYHATFNFVGAQATCAHRHSDDVCIEIMCGPPYTNIGASERLGAITKNAPADPARVPDAVCAKHGQPGEQDWLGVFKYKSASDGFCYLHDWVGEHRITCKAEYPTLTGDAIPGPYNATFNFAGADAICYHRHADDVCIQIFCGPAYQNIGVGG